MLYTVPSTMPSAASTSRKAAVLEVAVPHMLQTLRYVLIIRTAILVYIEVQLAGWTYMDVSWSNSVKNLTQTVIYTHIIVNHRSLQGLTCLFIFDHNHLIFESRSSRASELKVQFDRYRFPTDVNPRAPFEWRSHSFHETLTTSDVHQFRRVVLLLPIVRQDFTRNWLLLTQVPHSLTLVPSCASFNPSADRLLSAVKFGPCGAKRPTWRYIR